MQICDRSFCTGCSSCANICPRNCISMRCDEEGFYKPIIDENICIRCAKCVSHCPQNVSVKLERNKAPKVYAAFSKNEDQMMKSTSGGIFPLLAEQVIQMGGSVYGACSDRTFKVSFIRIENQNELIKLQGSKYVQSSIGMVYKQVLDDLNNGRKVLFSGVPCQIGGLYSYLGKDYANLYTVDVICRGVPSERVLQDYIVWKEKSENSKMVDLIFRHKVKKWRPMSYGTAVCSKFDNGMQYNKKPAKDAYYAVFLKNIAMMESCYHCRFNGFPRVGDVTLGDFAGLGVTKKSNIYHPSGISQVLCNSEKGMELFKKCSDRVVSEEKSLDECCHFNLNLWLSSTKNPNREKFFKDLDEYGIETVVKKYIYDPRSRFIQIIKEGVIKMMGEKNVLLLMHMKRFWGGKYPTDWPTNQYIKGNDS